MSSRRNIQYFLIFTLLFWTIGPLMVYVIDPYHIFHETRWNKDTFYCSIADQPYCNLGLIESFLRANSVCCYDVICLGDSRTRNFYARDLAKAVHGNGCLKLCLSGANAEELRCEGNRALKSKKIKAVVYGFSGSLFVDTQRSFMFNLYQHKALSLVYIRPYRLLLKKICARWSVNLQNSIDWVSRDNLDIIHDESVFLESRFPLWVQSSNLSELKKQNMDCNSYHLLQRVNESTSQRVNESTSQRVNESTSQRVNESTMLLCDL